MDAIMIIGGLKKTYDAIMLEAELSCIYKSIANVYSDISEAHFKSAKQAIIAAKTSNDSNMEIRIAIGHLRDSYNVLMSLENKTRKIRSFLFQVTEKEIIENKYRFWEQLSFLSSILSVLYKNIEEYENASFWEKCSLDTYSKAIEILTIYDLPYSVLESINPDYITEEIETDYNYRFIADGVPDEVTETTRLVTVVSSQAYNDIDKIKEIRMSCFKEVLKESKLKL